MLKTAAVDICKLICLSFVRFLDAWFFGKLLGRILLYSLRLVVLFALLFVASHRPQYRTAFESLMTDSQGAVVSGATGSLSNKPCSRETATRSRRTFCQAFPQPFPANHRESRLQTCGEQNLNDDRCREALGAIEMATIGSRSIITATLTRTAAHISQVRKRSLTEPIPDLSGTISR